MTSARSWKSSVAQSGWAARAAAAASATSAAVTEGTGAVGSAS